MNITSFRFSLLLLTGLIVLWVPSLAQENNIFTQAELLQDAKQLASILEKSHPDPYSNGGGKVAFQRRRQELLQNIPAEGMTTERFYRLLLPFVASLHDGHTAILPLQTGTQPRPGLPITFKIIDESLAVAGAVHKDNVDLRGALLLAVEGVPIRELVQRQNNLRGIENVYGTLALLSRGLGTERGLQNLLPEWTDLAKIGLTLRMATGENRDFFFQPGEKIENPPTQLNTKVRMPDMSRSDVAW
ncbi:MAG: hypothetical protein WCL37_06980, partial [Chrysiogenales bacterium]